MAKHERPNQNNEPAYLDSKPPEADVVLTQFLEGRRLPRIMPQLPHDAAHWWIAHQESMDKSEWPKLIQAKDQKFWKTPYIDRLIDTLRKFISLSEKDQQFIISATEDNVRWRGDNMDFFSKVYDENMRMRKIGCDEYIKQANGLARKAIRK